MSGTLLRSCQIMLAVRWIPNLSYEQHQGRLFYPIHPSSWALQLPCNHRHRVRFQWCTLAICDHLYDIVAHGVPRLFQTVSLYLLSENTGQHPIRFYSEPVQIMAIPVTEASFFSLIVILS